MRELNKPIGIFGGTFDPIHCGHIEIAKAVHTQCDLVEIRFIPCKQPILKNQAQATAEQRLAMLEIACRHHPDFIIDDREIKRDIPSYTVETLHSLRTELPDTPLCLILGVDAYAELPNWHHWQEIINLSHLIIINRPNYAFTENPQLNSFYQEHAISHALTLKKMLAGGILQLSLPPLPYASRIIRQQISEGKNLESALPEGVWAYIKKHHLYKKLKKV